MTKQKYKKTEIGLIPGDWEAVSFEDAILKGRVKVGKIKQQEYERVGKCPVVDQSQNYIAGYTDKEDKLYQGTLPVIIFGDHTRAFKFVDFPFVIGADGVKIILPDTKRFDPKFSYYAMSNLEIESRGYNRHYPLLREKKIPLPPISEQRKIARVLSTIQRAVEQQDKIIEATKRLKKSLMQKLFRFGISDLGVADLKETEIGLIPKRWEVAKAKEICVRVTDGTHDTPKPSDEGYLLITSKNLKNGKLDFASCYLISRKDFFEVNKRSKVDLYDVIFGMIGTIGSPILVTEEYPEFAIKNVGLFKTEQNKELGLWLYYYLSTDILSNFVNSHISGTSQRFIPLWFLRNLPIILATPDERKEIIEVLQTVDKKIEIEQRRKATLKELFRTMLHKLMSGEVRVRDVEFKEG